MNSPPFSEKTHRPGIVPQPRSSSYKAYVLILIAPALIGGFFVFVPDIGVPVIVMITGVLPSSDLGENGMLQVVGRPGDGEPIPPEGPGGTAGDPEDGTAEAPDSIMDPGGRNVMPEPPAITDLPREGPEDLQLDVRRDLEDGPATAPADPPSDPVDNRTAARLILEKARTHKVQSSCADPPSNEIGTSTQINRVVDANTIETGDGRMRLALIGDYKPGLQGFNSAVSHLRDQCTSLGRHIVYDADERLSAGPDGLIVAKVWCYGGDVTLGCSINEHLLVSNSVELYVPHCSDSKFGDEDWAKNAGC